MKISFQNVQDILNVISGLHSDIKPDDVLYLYDVNRCGTCGSAWKHHEGDCFRHPLRDLYLSLRLNLIRNNANFDEFFKAFPEPDNPIYRLTEKHLSDENGNSGFLAKKANALMTYIGVPNRA